MMRLMAKILRRVGLLRFDLLASVAPVMPDRRMLKPGEMTVVIDCGIEKWACLGCPGGCGQAITLPLNPNRRPRWKVRFDLWRRPSVEPSVWQKNECGCHFWIRDGVVHWCEDGRPRLTEMAASVQSRTTNSPAAEGPHKK